MEKLKTLREFMDENPSLSDMEIIYRYDEYTDKHNIELKEQKQAELRSKLEGEIKALGDFPKYYTYTLYDEYERTNNIHFAKIHKIEVEDDLYECYKKMTYDSITLEVANKENEDGYVDCCTFTNLTSNHEYFLKDYKECSEDDWNEIYNQINPTLSLIKEKYQLSKKHE